MKKDRHHTRLKSALAELGSRLNSPGIVKEIELALAQLKGLQRMVKTPLRRPRDPKGWRVPREGTKSRQVYDMLKAKKSTAEIRRAIPGLSSQLLYNLTADIKKPDKSNANRLEVVKLKRDRSRK